MVLTKKKINSLGKKGQVDIAIVIGSIIIPVSALIGALMLAWLMLSPVVDLCRMAQIISYDIVSLTDVVYSVPDDLTIIYGGPATCEFYSRSTYPIRVILEFKDTKEPPDLPDTYNWYRGEMITETGPLILVVDKSDAISYSYYIDLNRNTNFSDDGALSGMVVGSKFEIDDRIYTIQEPHFVAENLQSAVFSVETTFKTIKNTMACMNRRLIINQFETQVISYDTFLFPAIQKTYAFYSRGAIPATLYDAAGDGTFYTMMFNFRSYANSRDESLIHSGGSRMFKVDDGVYISKTRTAYHDTIASSAFKKDDILIEIAKIALQTCNTGLGTITSSKLPPGYSLERSGNVLNLYNKAVPTNRTSPYQYLVSSMEPNNFLGGSGCTYLVFDITPSVITSTSDVARIKIQTIISGSDSTVVLITLMEETA